MAQQSSSYLERAAVDVRDLEHRTKEYPPCLGGPQVPAEANPFRRKPRYSFATRIGICDDLFGRL
jgi:hypothetical protein